MELFVKKPLLCPPDSFYRWGRGSLISPTAINKASIKQVLEFARRKIVFFDINFVYVAKHHYQEDRGYTKGDIFLIADWLEKYIKSLQEAPAPDSVETLITLQQARQKFIDEGILEDPTPEQGRTADYP